MTAHPVRNWWWPPLLAALAVAAPWPARLVDAAYSRVVYRWIQATLTTVSNITPWTWLDVLVAVALVLCIRRGVLLRTTYRREGGVRGCVEAVQRVLRAGGLAVIVFVVAWGLNYRRTPLMTDLTSGATATKPTATVEELRQLTSDALALAARSRPAARRALLSYDEIARVLPTPFNRALDAVGRPGLVVPGRPKFTVFTPFFTRAGVTGMVDPFALESIVHPDLLPFERPFVLAHEWAHLAGLADESEASAIGWSACMRGTEPLVYSASMYLVVEAGAALPVRVWREWLATADPGVREDLQALRERMALIQPTVRQASFKVYDQYLRANAVEDGVRSYSRALQLIMQPVLRDQLNGLRSDPVDPARRP